MGRDNDLVTRKEKLVWGYLPAILIIVTLPLSLISPLHVWVGFYYLEAMVLLFLSVYYVSLYRVRHNGKWLAGGRKTSAAIIIASVPAIAFIIFLAIVQYHFISELEANAALGMSNVALFLNSIEKNPDTLVVCGYLIHKALATEPLVHALLGIIYGLISVLVTFIGSRFKLDRSKVKDVTYLPISCIVILSVTIAVMIFAVKDESFMRSLRYSFVVMSLLLGALFLSLGLLVPPRTKMNDASILSLFIATIVSFTIGFVFGNLAMPLTRVEYPVPSYGTFYRVFPGVYFFMYSSMIMLAVVAYMLADKSSGLYRITKGLVLEVTQTG